MDNRFTGVKMWIWNNREVLHNLRLRLRLRFQNSKLVKMNNILIMSNARPFGFNSLKKCCPYTPENVGNDNISTF
jgi:hypothetical protein